MGSTKGVSFNADNDIADLTGKVIIVTGGNIGLGKESILQFSKHNASKIFMGSRSEAKAQEAIREIKQVVPNAPVVFLKLDLASFASVKNAAIEVLSTSTRLDILMNNAGIMATPAGTTEDGYEIQFGTNHMGHALFTKLLLPLLEKTAAEPNSDVRIINISSAAHTRAPKTGLVLSEVKTPMSSTSAWVRYGQSKLANIYFTKHMAKLYPTIRSVAVHPGLVNTNLTSGMKKSFKLMFPFSSIAKQFLFTRVEEGALGQLWAATGKKEDVKLGGYYYPVGLEFEAADIVNDPKMAEKLWDFTEKELRDHGF